MIPLCVTADDFGLSRDVNEGIRALATGDALSAVSVMVHDDAILDDASSLSEHVATGLHLVLVGERPLLRDRLAPLLDADGFLPMSYWSLFVAVARDRAVLPLLADEIAAQVERYCALGLRLDYVNSHQHVHLLPPIWSVLMRVLTQLGRPLPALRVAHHGPWGGVRQSMLHLSSQIAWSAHPAVTDTVLNAIGIDFAGHTTLTDVDRMLGRLASRPGRPGGSVVYELVTHPGFEQHPAAARHAAWRYHWRNEHDLLASPAFHALLHQHGAVMTRPSAATASLTHA